MQSAAAALALFSLLCTRDREGSTIRCGARAAAACRGALARVPLGDLMTHGAPDGRSVARAKLTVEERAAKDLELSGAGLVLPP